jgi:hypothetical protein
MTPTENPTITTSPDGRYTIVAAHTVPANVIGSLARCNYDEYAAYNHYVGPAYERYVGYTARIIDGTTTVVITDNTN